VKFGPQYGYFPDPGKSYYICKAEDEDAARQACESFGLDINYLRGQRYLGGFIGSAEKKEEWLVGMVDK
jgi:nucleoside-diphosphate-sugar epimerase